MANTQEDLSKQSTERLKEAAWLLTTSNPRLQPILDELATRGITAQMGRDRPDMVLAFYAKKD